MVNWKESEIHNKLKPFDEKKCVYDITQNTRKQESIVPDDKEGWVELDWERFEFTEECLWRRPRLPEDPPPKEVKSTSREKFCYIGAPKLAELDLACRPIMESFDSWGLYLVGSSLLRSDFRDVDIRMIMEDKVFYTEFPNAHEHGSWSLDTKWMLLTTSISGLLSKQTGLNIDFQFQPQSYANSYHNKERHPLGNRMPPKEKKESD